MLFVSWTGSLAILATLRLDLASVLPDSDAEADEVAAVVAWQALAVSLVLTLGCGLYATIRTTVSPEASTAWLWLVGPMVFAMALAQLSAGMMTRTNRFLLITVSNSAAAIGFAVSGLAVSGIAEDEHGALAFCRLLGQVAAVVLMLLVGGLRARVLVRRVNWARQKEIYAKYIQFIKFNTPYSLIGAFARDIPLYALALAIDPKLAAYYGIARSSLIAPTILMSAPSAMRSIARPYRGCTRRAFPL